MLTFYVDRADMKLPAPHRQTLQWTETSLRKVLHRDVARWTICSLALALWGEGDSP